MGSTFDVNRRDLIKRAAAAGLIAVPAVGALSSCASGSGTDNAVDKGEKSKDNPLAVNKTAALEVYVFDGGFGKDYVENAAKVYEKRFPKADVKVKATQKIQTELQPRFNGGNPPDLIDNSGAEQMDMGVLVSKKQLADLTDLLKAPSLDDPNKTVADTLRPGVAEMGKFGTDKTYVMNFAYTVYGVWYSQTALDKLGVEYPKTWDDMLAVCKKAKKKGIAGWTYAGKYPYYIPFSLYPFIAKIGGREVITAIDNLEPDAWKHPAVKAALEAYYELYKKGYILQGTPGLTHIQSQTAWNKGEALFIPNGSWVENESSKTTPDDFEMRVAPPSSLDSGDKMPFETTWASGGEPYIVPAHAKNPVGGMEQLRILLGKDAARSFVKNVSSLTAFNGGTDGLDMPPGLTSAVDVLDKAGDNIVNPMLPVWYVTLEKEKIGTACLGEMMAGRMTPAECIKKAQKFTDEAREDDSIKKYKH